MTWGGMGVSGILRTVMTSQAIADFFTAKKGASVLIGLMLPKSYRPGYLFGQIVCLSAQC
jgi:hypothetical protein